MDTVCVWDSPRQVEFREIILPPHNFTAIFPAGHRKGDYFRRRPGTRRSSGDPLPTSGRSPGQPTGDSPTRG